MADDVSTAVRWLIGISLLLLLAFVVGLRLQRGSDGPAAAAVAVEPFAVEDPPPVGWDSEQVADSIATALGYELAEPVHVIGHGGGRARWVLRGMVTRRDQRLVIRAVLHGSDTSAVLWSATFWRDSTDGHSVIEQLVAGTSEALRSSRAPQTLTEKH